LEAVANNASSVSLAESASLGERIERIFHRASMLLRNSMDLDGVVFLDAARTNPSLWVVQFSISFLEDHADSQAACPLMTKPAGSRCPRLPYLSFPLRRILVLWDVLRRPLRPRNCAAMF
jgi:hypothetical protein